MNILHSIRSFIRTADAGSLAAAARKAGTTDERIHAKRHLLAAGRALGLLQQLPADWFSRGTDAGDDARIQALVEERIAAKKARDFARADAIREQLAAEGIALEDTPQGVRWRRA